MRKTILLSSVLAVSAAMLCLARPIRDRFGAREYEFQMPNIEPLSTEYIQVDLSRYNQRACQVAPVEVGYETDFVAGSRLVFNVTVLEWDASANTVFATMAGYGYMWHYLAPIENLEPGRHTIEWVNQKSHTVQYRVAIDGRPSLNTYTTCWQPYGSPVQVQIGSRYTGAGYSFKGLYHSIELYDSFGQLRHRWIPDPTGVFYDEVTGEMTSVLIGSFIYGDLANE